MNEELEHEVLDEAEDELENEILLLPIRNKSTFDESILNLTKVKWDNICPHQKSMLSLKNLLKLLKNLNPYLINEFYILSIKLLDLILNIKNEQVMKVLQEFLIFPIK